MTTFVSSSWGGRVSDKHLTMNSELLQKLLPGDVVLADRGFNVGVKWLPCFKQVYICQHLPNITPFATCS